VPQFKVYAANLRQVMIELRRGQLPAAALAHWQIMMMITVPFWGLEILES